MIPVSYRTKCRRKLSGSKFHANPLVDVAMRRRGVYASSRMNYELRNMLHFSKLKGINEASKIIADAIMSNKKILILADYDCDGATACATMVKGLRMLGCKNVDYAIPDRFTMGYGTTPALVDSIAHRKPDLIITVDNGISSFSGIDRIREVLPQTQIVVTDHHMASSDGRLPNADAVVNPNQAGCEFESKNLCGCGVAWYVTLAVRSLMRERGDFKKLNIEEPNLAYLIDLVALATIADVVPLDYNNRIFVSVGIKLIRSGHGCPGINAMFTACGKKIDDARSSDFAFGIGPRINSAGRLDDMKIGVICLLADDIGTANLFATELCRTNDNRKSIQNRMISKARLLVEKMDNKLSLVVHDEEFNEGVIGLVSSRLKETYGVPTFVFTTNESGMMKASGRSIPGVHLYEVLHEINDYHATENGIPSNGETLIPNFGGHAMAAGLSLPAENFEEFCRILEIIVSRRINKPLDVLETDGFFEPQDLTYQNVSELQDISPWGQGFQEPLLETRLSVVSSSLSKNEKHIFYTLTDGTNKFNAVAFNSNERPHMFRRPSEDEDRSVHIVFRADISEFRGQKEMKFILESAV